MRIIGGKDYYDGIVGDYDSDRTFVRSNFAKTEPVQNLIPEHILPPFSRYRSPFRPVRIIFAGVKYNGIYTVNNESFLPAYLSFKYSSMFANTCWQAADFLKKYPDVHLDTARRSRNHLIETYSDLEEYFKPVKVNDNTMKVLIDNNISVAIGVMSDESKDDWYINCDGLRYFNFARALDPYQAYQNLDMWIGSQLAKEENKMIKLDDKLLIAKHGYDKYSFRKMKE